MPNSKKRKLCETDLKPAQDLMTRASKRRTQNSLAHFLDYLESVRAVRHPPVHKMAKHEKVTIDRHRSLEKVAWVIYLRYGSMKDDAQVMHTF